MTELIEYTGNFCPYGGEILCADVRYSGKYDIPRPIVLILHGFTAFRRWGFFPYLGTCLANAGAISVVPDFSHNGYGGETDKLLYPELFAMNTVGRELAEISALLAALRGSEFPGWNGVIYLLGHSRGGGEAILAACADGVIPKIAVWSCISTFDRFSPRQKQRWRESGFFSVSGVSREIPVGMNVAYLDDVEIPERSIVSAAGLLTAELLLIHGEQDVTVPVRESEKIRSAKQDALVEIIPNAGHTFGVAHPFTRTTPALEAAIARTIRFFSLSGAQ